MNRGNEAYPAESQTSQRRINQNTDDIIKMKVPLHMVDFRFMATMTVMIVVFIIISLIDHLYRTIWTYLGVALITVLMLIDIYVQTHHEIAIYNDAVAVKKPFTKEKRIPVGKINNISDFSNTIWKYRKLYFVTMGFMILLITAMSISSDYRLIESYGLENATNISMTILPTLIFTMLFFNAYRMSHYPKAIKIDINPGEIKLYPENEEKYLLLKEKLESLLR